MTPYQPACVRLGLGEKDEAYRELECGLEERTPWLACEAVAGDPVLEPFRGDPRLEEILSRFRQAVKLPKGASGREGEVFRPRDTRLIEGLK